MKRTVLFAALLFAVLLPGLSQLFAQQSAGPAALMLNHYATRNFAEGAIPRSDLEQIVQAGVRAPSAGNRQSWHFTVVQNPALSRQILTQTVDGNALIVISAPGDGKTNNVQILDCALAAQNIYLAAQALGYGSRIYTAPIDAINSRFKTELGLPSGYSAVALVRVGKLPGPVDAVSGASARKRAEEVVTYK